MPNRQERRHAPAQQQEMVDPQGRKVINVDINDPKAVERLRQIHSSQIAKMSDEHAMELMIRDQAIDQLSAELSELKQALQALQESIPKKSVVAKVSANNGSKRGK